MPFLPRGDQSQADPGALLVFACAGCPPVGPLWPGPLPAGTVLRRLTCTRAFEPAHVLGQLLGGAAGALIVGCAEGPGWGAPSDYEVEERLRVLRRLLGQAGLAPNRAAAEWIALGEWRRVGQAIERLRCELDGTPGAS